MNHPVFFSFASDSKQYAQRLKEKFSDDLVYIYTRTGIEGAAFPSEIMSELMQCRIFVLFLSADYVKSDPKRPWCRRELITAAKRISQGNLDSYLIIQVDETSLESVIEDPETGTKVDPLKIFREERRALSNPFRERTVERMISIELSKIDNTDHPILARTDYQQELRSLLATSKRAHKTPITFVSGFHGTGRRTLIRSIMGSDFKHLTEYSIPLDSIDGPEDFLLSLWGEVLQKTRTEQRQMMKDVALNPKLLERYFAQISSQLTALKGYIIVTKDDALDIGEVLPRWTREYLPLLNPSVQPLLFFVTNRALPSYLKETLENIAEMGLPALDDNESEELVSNLIGAFDPTRIDRWDPHIDEILDAGANNSKLLVDIVRLASKKSSLDFLKKDAAATVARFDERVQKVADWAWSTISNDFDAISLLDVINLLNVVHIDALQEIFSTSKSTIGELLYKLVQIGLVEHLTGSVYRIPRALARKLNIYLTGRQDLRKRSMTLLRKFAKEVDVGKDDDGGVALINHLHARLATDAAIPEEDMVFVTAAMLFKAGWHRYRLAQYSAALKMLRRAFETIDKVHDDATKLEITRFYGLAACREHIDADVNAACQYLRRNTKFRHIFREKASAMASFLRGFSYRCKSDFVNALPFYEKSLELFSSATHDNVQKTQIMNEIVQCILRIEPVNYGRAVELAQNACSLRETPNNLDVLLRSLLAQTYRNTNINPSKLEENIKEMNKREAQLREKCEGSGLSFYAFRRIDRMREESIASTIRSKRSFPSIDLQESIRECQVAYDLYQEDALLWRKWDLMLMTEIGRDWPNLHHEADAYLRQAGKNKMEKGNAARIKILTYDLSDQDQKKAAYVEFDKYKSERIFPKSVSTDIKRQLDSGNPVTGRLFDRINIDLTN